MTQFFYFLKIIVLSILLAVVYGILHDLITTQISIEYFTIGHPKIIESDSPIKLALIWGIIATWWVGLILGILIAIFATIGNNPLIPFRRILVLITKLMVIMFCTAIIAGLIGYITAKNDIFYLVDNLATQIESSRHHLFLTAGWSHSASYITGIVGGLIICIKIWKERKSILN